ncbi:FMN-dependent dehydrogenase-domain-containing protein [Zychaea mexicana]|uniref:FMN-dependent dehydrogenase-domain-containing protein n=1 Tax=Zychaea mexicana TaxID=64656 RepID=UPI0022FDED6D|nr:FMN-dependent dehydrogenase-domain-containing protein [Zychaea mexicana]KAI9497419.1 FMN-dependent dehydrogenase-domain-containing protein [Zychaea mexicana]
MMIRTIPLDEVAQHNKQDDLWIIIHGKVYDLTKFLPEHPGGQNIILKYAGKDGTRAFEPMHPIAIIDRFLSPDVCLGQAAVNPASEETVAELETEEEKRVRLAREGMPKLEEMYNSFDFESVARSVLKADAYYYFSSGASDEISMRENHNAYHRIWLRPRVMVNVAEIATMTTMLGSKVSMPLYISATAMNKMAHPEAEKVLTRAAGKCGIIQMIPTLACYSLDDLVEARVHSDQPQWFQLYVDTDRKVTQRIVQQAEAKGVKGLFITVDLAGIGRREKYLRQKYKQENFENTQSSDDHKSKSSGSTTSAPVNKRRGTLVDPSLNWSDIAWFKSITKMPIILKGIQRYEDAVLAYKYGCAGVVLSNHGGRQLDFSPSPIEILPEVIDALKCEGCDPRKDFEVYVDGGIRRGSDIFKALALGAKGCGIGRPSLYAMACYGDEGVKRLLEIYQNELEICMRLMGAPTIADIKPEMVDIRNLKNHFVSSPTDYLAQQTYEKLQPTRAADGSNSSGGYQLSKL